MLRAFDMGFLGRGSDPPRLTVKLALTLLVDLLSELFALSELLAVLEPVLLWLAKLLFRLSIDTRRWVFHLLPAFLLEPPDILLPCDTISPLSSALLDLLPLGRTATAILAADLNLDWSVVLMSP